MGRNSFEEHLNSICEHFRNVSDTENPIERNAKR